MNENGGNSNNDDATTHVSRNESYVNEIFDYLYPRLMDASFCRELFEGFFL